MPFSRSCSIGTVISCSTSAEDNPRASVCTSTVTGAYSGSTSTGIERSSETPTTSVSAASATTSNRNFMLHATIQWVIAATSPSAPGPERSSGFGPGAHPFLPGGFRRDPGPFTSLTPPVSRLPHSPVSCGAAMYHLRKVRVKWISVNPLLRRHSRRVSSNALPSARSLGGEFHRGTDTPPVPIRSPAFIVFSSPRAPGWRAKTADLHRRFISDVQDGLRHVITDFSTRTCRKTARSERGGSRCLP